jgi:GTP diphosphokinase / guanosine-3',5'-bis(diphosphate) 3'-diphosphatase
VIVRYRQFGHGCPSIEIADYPPPSFFANPPVRNSPNTVDEALHTALNLQDGTDKEVASGSMAGARMSVAQFETNLILKALSFAAYKHRHQRRKGSKAIPYINHPIAVADLLVRTGNISDPEVIATALLHDTIEDTRTTKKKLKAEFGTAISRLVLELSDDKSLPKKKRKRRQVEHASSLSPRARIVKLADKICNLRDVVRDPPAKWSLKRKQHYFDWAKEVVDKIRGTNIELEKAFDEAFAKRP